MTPSGSLTYSSPGVTRDVLFTQTHYTQFSHPMQEKKVHLDLT